MAVAYSHSGATMLPLRSLWSLWRVLLSLWYLSHGGHRSILFRRRDPAVEPAAEEPAAAEEEEDEEAVAAADVDVDEIVVDASETGELTGRPAWATLSAELIFERTRRF